MLTESVYNQTATERVHLGRPAAEAVADEAHRMRADRVFLVASESLRQGTDEITAIEEALGDRCAGSYAGIPPHAPRQAVLAATEAARDGEADLIVSVGGGSVTDAAKIVSLCLKHEIKRHEDFDAFRMQVTDDGGVHRPSFEGPDVRVLSVPTTLSGGEFNPLSGATDERTKIKQGYEHGLMVPVAVILDPRITRHTPEWLWLSTGVRAVDHAAETLGSYQSNEFCDSQAESALRLLNENLRKVRTSPDDYEARLQCQIGAWQSMLPIVSGVPMGISHATGHALGGTFDVPHGHTSCAVAAAALAFNAPVNSDRQARISRAFGAPDRPASELVRELVLALGMPASLGDVGISESDLETLSGAIMHDFWARTNPRPIESRDDVVAFLETAL